MSLGFGVNTTTNNYNPNKDFEVQQPPSDSISSLAWSPKANMLVSGSWDNEVRCWKVEQNFQSTPLASMKHDAPVLCANWTADGKRIISGGCDNKAKLWSLENNSQLVIGQHNAPIKHIFWVEELQCVLTASWDKTLKYWTGNSPNPACSVDLPERVYCMDVKGSCVIVGTAERNILIYDLRKPQVEYRKFQSPLKYQSRVLSIFPDKSGFALGSIEGRVAIHHVEEKDSAKNFAFKCHRENNTIYAVNAISFHPTYGTFATAGADGAFYFWDKDFRNRLKPFSPCSAPISAAAFNADGSMFAYGVSYDWSKGVEYYNPQQKNYILIHNTTEAEIKSKGKTGKK